MKLLLDENLPRKLKYRFSKSFEVFTVPDMGWNNKENGELLKLLQQGNFKALITSDKNLVHQQKIDKYDVQVVVLDVKDNRYETVLPLVEKIQNSLLSNPVGHILIIK
jgi:predicted nuclease of predicted toxin-antitoxin system